MPRKSDTRTASQTLLEVVMLVMRTLSAEMRQSPKPLGPMQMGTLMRIAVGPCTMSELARHQAVSLPTISKSVDVLVRRHLVERWIDVHDRRQTLVRLTPAGKQVLADMRRTAVQHVARHLTPLTAAQRADLIAALDVLKKVLPVNERTP